MNLHKNRFDNVILTEVISVKMIFKFIQNECVRRKKTVKRAGMNVCKNGNRFLNKFNNNFNVRTGILLIACVRVIEQKLYLFVAIEFVIFHIVAADWTLTSVLKPKIIILENIQAIEVNAQALNWTFCDSINFHVYIFTDS